ncbi:MAG: hypothetical protein AB8I08_16875 [Sandaracinaceae bacterium]
MDRGICYALVIAVSFAAPLSMTFVPSQGRAQEARVALPLTVRGVLDSRSETSCSQSYASDHHRADLTLLVTRSGRATLTSESHTRSRSGPSIGAYRMGERDFSLVQSREHAELTGRTERRGARLVITFDRLEHAQARWSGEGELPLPAPTSTPLSATMRCASTPTAVYPAQVSETEQPETLDVLACTMETRLDGLEAFGLTWHFAPGPGLLTPWDETWLGRAIEQRRRVRRVR